MKRFIFIFTLLLSFNWVYAQTVYSGMAAQYAAEGNFEKAIELELEGIRLLLDLKGNDCIELANTFQNISNYSSELGNYEGAIKLAYEALKIYENINGKGKEYTDCLYNISIYHFESGNSIEAINILNKIISIKKTDSAGENNNYAGELSVLASIFAHNKEYYKAIQLINEALEYLRNKDKKDDSFYSCLSKLAYYRFQMAQYEEALRIGLELLDYKNTIKELNPLLLADYLNEVSGYYLKMGDYTHSLDLINESISIRKSVSDDENASFALTLINLACIEEEIGNINEAINLSNKALQIFVDLINQQQLDYQGYVHYALGLNNLAVYYSKIGDHNKSLVFNQESLKVKDWLNLKESENYAMSLNNIGVDYLSNRDMEMAFCYLNKAIDLYEKLKLFDHPDYANSLLNLSEVYLEKNELKNAFDFGYKALNIYKSIYGTKNNIYISSLRHLATYNYIIKDSINLIINNEEIYSNLIKIVRDFFSYMTSEDRRYFWDKNKFWAQKDIFKYSHSSQLHSLNKISFNCSLLSKGLLLNSEMEFDKFLTETGDEALLEKYNKIKSLRLQLNKLYEKPIAERYVDTDSLEKQANELERQLMQESAEFGDYTRNLTIRWEDVRDNLKEKDAAIEFVNFPLNNDSTMYMAYVLRPNMEAPELVKLFEEKDLTSLIDEDDKASIYTSNSASELIWGKLKPQLEGVENVYFAPDGVLHQIAIEYLPNIDGDGMISDRFNLHRVSSTREIALNRHNAATKEAVVYGGIKYDTDVTTMETESRKYDRTKTRGFSNYYNLGDSSALRGSLEYLDGSLTEAENINGMMKENNYNSTFLSGNDATEESFKNLSGKANGIIHISTHGFYWTESEAERKASLNDQLMFMSQLGDNARRNVEDKALTRTGLFMAGAKNALGGVELPDDVDDGILTAQEIANLDLRGLDLVVLSACKTGMGDISGDGVFGLQRGFKKAGANTILMSLWDVSDEATQVLMTEFYRNYLSGKSKQESLRHAQQYLRNYTDGEEDYSDAKYWAAFILLDALN